jgi:hypothetical protein
MFVTEVVPVVHAMDPSKKLGYPKWVLTSVAQREVIY